MKLPCELIVSEVLPTVRGELAKELVKVHGYTQSNVAKIFGVTGAAVSQYIKGTRGGNALIDNSPFKEEFYRQIAAAADRVVKGDNVANILCDICNYAKTSGLLDYINKSVDKSENLPKCVKCPKDPVETTGRSTDGTF